MGDKQSVTRSTVVMAAAILGLLLPGFAFAQSGVPTPYTDVYPFNPTSFKQVGLKVLWRTHNPMSTAGIKKVHILQDLLILEDGNGFINSYDRIDGELKGNSFIPGGSEGAISDDAENIYICAGTSLVAIDKKTGERYCYDLPFAPSSGVASDDFNLYIGSYDGKLYALSRMTKPQQPRPLWPYKWAHSSGTVVMGRAFSNGMFVYYGSTDGYVYAANGSDGSSVWRLKTGFDVIADIVPSTSLWHRHNEPAPDPKTVMNAPVVYAAGMDGFLYALYAMPASGTVNEADVRQVKWRFKCGGMLRKPPAVAGDTVYLSPEGKGLIAVDSGGRQKWANPLAGSFVALGSNVYCATADGREMWALSPEDGKPNWKMNISSFANAVQNPYDDVIYLVTKKGEAFAVAEQ